MKPIMLKILREDFGQAVVLRVCPELCVEPVQLVRRASANGITENGFIRVKNRELFQFRFSQSVGLLEDHVAANGARYGRDELNDRLMRHAHGVFDDALSENLGCDLLLPGKAAIEPIDQNFGIN